MPTASSADAPSRGATQTPQWIIAILLAAIAAALWTRGDASLLPTAAAQNQPIAGARGIYAFTGQLDNNRYGLFMLDIDQGTIWCYEIEAVDGTRKLRLVAARTWIYDRYLQDFNSAQPDFRTVQKLVARQRAQLPGGREADGANDANAPTDPPP
jgi:hypothetical protein